MTNAGTETVLLGSAERKLIAQSLVDREFDQSKVARFAKAANRFAIFAYELELKMSTPGESQRWHRTVLKAIEQNDINRVRQLLSESADEFEGRWTLECELLVNDGGLLAALEVLRTYSEAEVTEYARRNKRTPRRRTFRQILAEDLVREWRIRFDEYPVYWIEEDFPPFLDVLKYVLHSAEAHYLRGERRAYVSEDGLRNLTKRACAAEKRRVMRESQISE